MSKNLELHIKDIYVIIKRARSSYNYSMAWFQFKNDSHIRWFKKYKKKK
jgi:hypothetical protein